MKATTAVEARRNFSGLIHGMAYGGSRLIMGRCGCRLVALIRSACGALHKELATGTRHFFTSEACGTT